MKPTVIPPAMDTNSAGPANGINIPINREYANVAHGASNSPQQYHHQQSQPTQQHHPQAHYHNPAFPDDGFGSPKTNTRQYTQQHAPNQQQQQIPAHFQQGFGFEPDMDIDMDMFPRSRLGRAHHDPFAGFGSSHFGFPSFATLGRRRAAGGAADPMADDDFFNRLPSEFRQYIPESFGQRRTGSGSSMPQQQQQPSYTQGHSQVPPEQYYQQGYAPTAPAAGTTPPTMPQSPTKRLCDAAIQTDDSVGHTETDGNVLHTADTLNQHGLRNTMDMGVKSNAETDMSGARAHSAPPPTEQQQQQNMPYQQPVNGKRPTPPPAMYQNQQQFGTQTTPPIQQGNFAGQYQQQPPMPQPQPHRTYYAPHPQAHPQQKQQTPPPPQTPGGTYIRTIPIFVEGRSEPIINAHKEIPNQNAPPSSGASANASASARAYAPNLGQGQQTAHQQQQRPPPLNTQQNPEEQQGQSTGLPPQTPHTLDSINKIQDIQRDVLELMAKVEQFKGTRKDKEYVYLDEMLTRNLLKLDTIDTNGKESIRLARKEAIKCIQASINVLEAKAEENASNKSAGVEHDNNAEKEATPANNEALTATAAEQEPSDEPTGSTEVSKSQEAIPLPPPPSAVAADAAQSVEGSTSGTAPSSEAAESHTAAGAGAGKETAPNEAQTETK